MIDEARRRAVTLECMRAVGGPATSSTSALGPDEITALFTYLAHLADGASLEKSARWVQCQEDYHTFNRARQADWHERATYGTSSKRLARDRFAGETSAAVGPLESLDPDEVRKRHLTMATRHRAKRKKAGAAAPAAPVTPPVRSAAPELKAELPF